MFEAPILIEVLAKHHDRTTFSCGIPELDRYFKEQAGQDVKRRTASVFVATLENRVIGFYTLSATAIARESLPVSIIRKLPKYPIPAVLLGRLAVALSMQGKKIGAILLVNAMKRALLASSTIGMYALIVDAKNERAKSFYQHFGFLPLEDQAMRLFIPLDTIATLVDNTTA